uniref:Uncharacterized protein n=1 Tax=Romanomermis culicivorax TaxID=13658 RepID=A0A915K5G4_ROMCU
MKFFVKCIDAKDRIPSLAGRGAETENSLENLRNSNLEAKNEEPSQKMTKLEKNLRKMTRILKKLEKIRRKLKNL